MSFPTTAVLDSFTAADGTHPPDANWTTPLTGDGGAVLTVQQGAVTAGGASERDGGYWNPSAFGPDCEVFCTVSTLPASGETIRIYLRLTPGSQTGYRLVYTHGAPGSVVIQRFTGGSATTLATIAGGVTLAAGEKIGLSAVGTVLTAYRYTGGAWTTLGSYDTAGDATKYTAAGNIGLVVQNLTVRVDSFGGGTYASAPPTNTAAPSVSGTAQVGNTLTGNDGTWTGSPTSYTRQWYRDNAGGGVYTAIPGATGSTYVLVDADDACNIKYGVVATNAGGSSAEVRSAAVGPIIEQLPSNTAAPSITGTAAVGSTLTGNDGTWTHVPTSYARQWYRDNQGGGTFAAIPGATGNTYVLVDADDQCAIEYGVVATNDDGSSAEVRSAATGQVVEPVPVNTVAPAVTGTARVGLPLTCDNGTWDHMAGSSASYTYQWRRSTDGGTTWTDITAATSSSYTPVLADVGALLDCVVSAHNSGSP